MTQEELELKEEIVKLKRELAEANARMDAMLNNGNAMGIYLDGVQNDYKLEILKELGKEKR